MVEVIDEILSNNSLAESDQEFLDKSDNGLEPRLIIIRDAALVMAEKKVPEKKIVELLQEHLETSKEIAQNIVNEINQKLIPYAKAISDEEETTPSENSDYSQELLEKIQQNAPTKTPKEEPLPAYEKKIEISNVEKNAEKLTKARTVINQEKKPAQGGKPDPYKEPLE